MVPIRWMILAAAALLLPALEHARDMAKSTSCLAQLRQHGLDLTMYVNEYGVTPAGSRHSYTARWEITLVRSGYGTTSETYWCPVNPSNGSPLYGYTNPCVCGVDSQLWVLEDPKSGGYGWNVFNSGNRYGMRGSQDWCDCCWYSSSCNGGLPNNSGIRPAEVERGDAIWLYCRHAHWAALNVTSETATAGRPDYNSPAYYPTGIEPDDRLRSYVSGQPTDQHVGGFNSLLSGGSAKHWEYGTTTIDDWTVWVKP